MNVFFYWASLSSGAVALSLHADNQAAHDTGAPTKINKSVESSQFSALRPDVLEGRIIGLTETLKGVAGQRDLLEQHNQQLAQENELLKKALGLQKKPSTVVETNDDQSDEKPNLQVENAQSSSENESKPNQRKTHVEPDASTNMDDPKNIKPDAVGQNISECCLRKFSSQEDCGKSKNDLISADRNRHAHVDVEIDISKVNKAQSKCTNQQTSKEIYVTNDDQAKELKTTFSDVLQTTSTSESNPEAESNNVSPQNKTKVVHSHKAKDFQAGDGSKTKRKKRNKKKKQNPTSPQISETVGGQEAFGHGSVEREFTYEDGRVASMPDISTSATNHENEDRDTNRVLSNTEIDVTAASSSEPDEKALSTNEPNLTSPTKSNKKTNKNKKNKKTKSKSKNSSKVNEFDFDDKVDKFLDLAAKRNEDARKDKAMELFLKTFRKIAPTQEYEIFWNYMVFFAQCRIEGHPDPMTDFKDQGFAQYFKGVLVTEGEVFPGLLDVQARYADSRRNFLAVGLDKNGSLAMQLRNHDDNSLKSDPIPMACLNRYMVVNHYFNDPPPEKYPGSRWLTSAKQSDFILGQCPPLVLTWDFLGKHQKDYDDKADPLTLAKLRTVVWHLIDDNQSGRTVAGGIDGKWWAGPTNECMPLPVATLENSVQRRLNPPAYQIVMNYTYLSFTYVKVLNAHGSRRDLSSELFPVQEDEAEVITLAFNMLETAFEKHPELNPLPMYFSGSWLRPLVLKLRSLCTSKTGKSFYHRFMKYAAGDPETDDRTIENRFSPLERKAVIILMRVLVPDRSKPLAAMYGGL